MSRSHRRRFVALVELLAQQYPHVSASAIAEGRVLVDGWFVTNPNAKARADADLRVIHRRRLRGDIKLSHALDTFGIPVTDRVCVDLGASAGGFTTALLNHGTKRVYAVDVGVGQLLGRLRVDPRVVNLEGHNVASIDRTVIPDVVGLITMDLSYLSASAALGQLPDLVLETRADLVILVKPTFELRAPTLVQDDVDVQRAVELVTRTMKRLGWQVRGQSDAPATGRRRAHEVFLHGRSAHRHGDPAIGGGFERR